MHCVFTKWKDRKPPSELLSKSSRNEQQTQSTKLIKTTNITPDNNKNNKIKKNDVKDDKNRGVKRRASNPPPTMQPSRML